jgi:hypothetical protein
MSAILKITSVLLFIFAGLYGLILCFGIVQHVLGTFIAFLSIIFLPFLLGLAPWYALFVYGDFTPLIVVYGGGIPAAILYVVSEKFE